MSDRSPCPGASTGGRAHPGARRAPWLVVTLAVALAGACGDPAEAPPSEPTPGDPLFAEVFDDVMPVLQETLDKQEVQGTLPERTFTWREDQRSNQRDINQLLDQALRALDTSVAQDVRQRIRQQEMFIATEQQSLTRFREQMVSAPTEDSLGAIDKMNPMIVTQEDLRESIAQAEQKIAAARDVIETLKDDLLRELRGIGLEVTEEEMNVLLDTVTGDDQISLAVVFHNIRNIAIQLETITRDSGEDLPTANRYYGLYVVLLQVLDLAQDNLVQAIEEEYLPRLTRFSEQASLNVQEAERLIRGGQGDPIVLQQNIASNRLTAQVIVLYQEHLRQHARALSQENEGLQKLIRTSQNTYATVRLSHRVAELIQTTGRDLQSITSMEVPPLRGFANEQMRAEFRRLSAELARD